MKPKVDIRISISNDVIKHVKNATFLGMVIDESLTWCDHLDLNLKKIISVLPWF